MKLTALCDAFKAFRIGDVVVTLMSMLLLVGLFQAFWQTSVATRVKVTHGDAIVGVYSLNQTRDIHIQGQLGKTSIHIHEGRARFVQSPCSNQYCVHQGWLSRGGQAAVCLPNQISLQLLGEEVLFDSLNY